MYIDFLKQDYSDKPAEKRQQYIDRDKQHLGGIIQERIANDIQGIVDRWYELNDIGYIPDNEKFLYLLKEAEQLYAFAYYTGTISIIGIASEEYCKFLMKKHGIAEVEKQVARINKLFSKKVLDQKTKSAFHKIREIRNDCMHYNTNFKNLTDNDLKKQAHKMIQSFKTCLKPLSCTATSHNGVIPDLFVSKEMTFRDFIYRNRNIQKKEHGIDLQIDPEIKQLAFTSRYYVEELDIDTNSFKEMTLIDMDRRMPLIVDLTLCQAKRLKEISLKEGSIIIATVISNVSTVGQTEEWLLLKLHDVYRETIDRAELEHYIQLLNTQQAKQ